MSPSTALLPLPMPSFWPYAGSPNNPKKRRDKEGAVTRALHVVICAVNYLCCARSRPPGGSPISINLRLYYSEIEVVCQSV